MNILFVCSGNTCRSPLAAALVRHKVACLTPVSRSASRASNIQVKSAGTAAGTGYPMSFAMEIILQEQNIDSTHQSQRLNRDLLDWADLILTMTRPQKILLVARISNSAPKLFTLNEYIGNTTQPDIDDPYDTDLESYRQCATKIEIACDLLLAKIHPSPPN
ncbi:MAG: low molecular weight protein arginine phosphatase [Cyanobacteria bacterium J06626_18]